MRTRMRCDGRCFSADAEECGENFPADTQWWEVELDAADLERVRVFPRSHWRKIAHGDFALSEIAENIRTRARRGSGRSLPLPKFAP